MLLKYYYYYHNVNIEHVLFTSDPDCYNHDVILVILLLSLHKCSLLMLIIIIINTSFVDERIKT